MSNQYVTITPNVINLNEFEPYSQVFEIEYNVPENPEVPLDPVPPETYDYVLHDVKWDLKEISKLTKINYVRLSDMSFSLSGNFSDIFDRALKYVNIDASKGQVARFGDMPEDYAALYSYTPPSISYKSIVFNVRMRPISGPAVKPPENTLHIYTVTAIVARNDTIANRYFQEAIKSGKYYEMALAAGKA
jgi:hypothetical protein